MTEDEVLDFARTALASIWALELLLLLHRSSDAAWQNADLVVPLRANARVIAENLAMLHNRGLVTLDETGRYRYSPATATLSEAVDALAGLYSRKPMAVTNAILSGHNVKIRSFADAFRFRTR
ncbi:MAG TPA: hypothetical protein VMB73_34915 [Acetobacteraceae bacterium]|nr:hypothetical protein [Acetobacteraceae bacterium]